MSIAGDQQIVIPIPLFLKKLWKMVNDENAEDVIGWNAAGDGFIIYDQLRFITELLPQYFKHNHLASFIRQLNFYDFHKIANTLKNELEFAHPYFLKDLPETLGFITRKCPNLKSKATSVHKKEEFNEVLNGVKELKTKHHMVENELQLLKQENSALWNEINSLRIKYSRQTKIINKLIHFLITYIHSHPNSFSKQNTSVTKKNAAMNLNSSPQLLQIDYLNAKQRISKSKKSNRIDDPSSSSSSRSVTIHKFPIMDIENLLQETDEEFPDNYTVSYPTQENEQSTMENPIEEILSDCDPLLEESTSYTVKFPKTKADKLKQVVLQKLSPSTQTITDSISSETSTQPVVNKIESKGKRIPLKRKFMKKSEENNLKVSKLSQEKNLCVKDNVSKHNESTKISSELDCNSQTSTIENVSPLIEEFKNSPIFDSSEFNVSSESIKTVPSSTMDMMKFNILENPKENFGMFLDNTQLQLGHLQELLNNMNAKEIVDLANCFNLSSNSSETADSETNNLNLISRELEAELSKLPSEVTISGPEEENKVCSINDSDLNNIKLENDLFNLM